MRIPSALLLTLTLIATTTIAQLQITLDTIVFDILQLDTAVQTLTASTASYTGGLLLSQGIDFLSVTGKLTQANTDISLLPIDTFTVAQVRFLENVVSQTLAIDNPVAVDTLIGKRDLIQKTPLQGGIVKSGLGSLLAGHLYFSGQVLDRTPEEEKAGVQVLVDGISEALRRGIDAFTVV